MSKKKLSPQEQQDIAKSKAELKEKKRLRKETKMGLPGAADKLQALKDYRALRFGNSKEDLQIKRVTIRL